MRFGRDEGVAVARRIATLDYLSAGRVTLASRLGANPRDFAALRARGRR